MGNVRGGGDEEKSERDKKQKEKRAREAQQFLDFLAAAQVPPLDWPRWEHVDSGDLNVTQDKSSSASAALFSSLPLEGVKPLLADGMYKNKDEFCPVRIKDGFARPVSKPGWTSAHFDKEWTATLRCLKYASGNNRITLDFDSVEAVNLKQIDQVLALAKKEKLAVTLGKNTQDYLVERSKKASNSETRLISQPGGAPPRQVSLTPYELYIGPNGKLAELEADQARYFPLYKLAKKQTFSDHTKALAKHPELKDEFPGGHHDQDYLNKITTGHTTDDAKLAAIDRELDALTEQSKAVVAAKDDVLAHTNGINNILQDTTSVANLDALQKVMDATEKSRDDLIEAIEKNEADIQVRRGLLEQEYNRLVPNPAASAAAPAAGAPPLPPHTDPRIVALQKKATAVQEKLAPIQADIQSAKTVVNTFATGMQTAESQVRAGTRPQ